MPEHIWKDVPEEEVKTYKAEPEDGQPVVGSGPFRLVEGTGRRVDVPVRGQPRLLGGAPHIDEVVFRVYKAEDPAIQALIKGEVDFAEDITALQVEALEGEDGITAHERRLTRLRRDRLQHRRRSTSRPASRSATGTRRCRTRRSATRSATPSTAT